MVIVFATVVFTGSVIKGARGCVGDLFARSIKTNQESSTSATIRSTEPQETVNTKPYQQKLQLLHHFPDHPKNSTTTQSRCFQSYSSNDFFICPGEVLTVKDQGDLNKELKESKQIRSKTATSAATKQDPAINDTSRIKDEVRKLSATEDNEPIHLSIRNYEKPKCVSFQTNSSPRSQTRPRRKRPKTLKKELEEAGLVIDESGQARIPTEPREESLTPKQCDEVDKDVQFEKLNQGQSGNSGNLHSSLANASITEDENTGSKHDKAKWSNDATSHCPGEGLSTDENAIVPVVLNKNREVKKSSMYKKHSKCDAIKVENENMHRVYEKEQEVASKDTNTDCHTPEEDKVQIPQETICYHCNRRMNADDLTESEPADCPPVYAGDTVQNRNKNQNHESQDIVSETGDFGKSTEINAFEVSATNANVGDMTRVKHRSQKRVEDKPLLHRYTQLENSGTLKESAKVDATKVTEGNCQPSTGNGKNEPQSSGVQHIQIVQANLNDAGEVVDTSAAIPISSNHSSKPQFLKIPLRSTVYADALDQVVGRFQDDGYGDVDTTQDRVNLSEEYGSNYDEEDVSGESDNSSPIEQSPGSVPDTPRSCIPSNVPLSHKLAVSHKEYECSDASMASHQVGVKKRLHTFLEDFSAFDLARAHWSRDFVLENNTPPRQNDDAIVMPVENRDKQRRRTERRLLRERIVEAPYALRATTKQTKGAELRLLMLVQEVGKTGSWSERSEEALQEERNLYRESLLHCCKLEEDIKAIDTRHRAVDVELTAMKRREWKTNLMHRAAQGEIKLLEHRIVKEQILQKEQRDKRLRDKRRRFQRTSLKVNTLLTLIVLQVILVIIIALWRL